MTDPPLRHPSSAEVAAAYMLDRAEAEATRVLAETAAADNRSSLTTLIRSAPSWARAYITRHNQAMEAEHHVCEHLHGVTTPTAIHIAVWAPGYVCCTDCAQTGMLNALCPPAEAHRCDVCRLDRPPGQLHAGLLRGGHVLIHFGICDPCNDSGVAGR